MIKRATLLLLLVLGTGTAWSKTVLILGDSLSSSYRVAKPLKWSSLLQEALGDRHTVKNFSKAGAATEFFSNNAQWVGEATPDVVYLALGSVDGLSMVDVSTVERNLTVLIEAAIKHDAQIILSPSKLPPFIDAEYRGCFDKMFSNLASAYKLTLGKSIIELVYQTPGLLQEDGLHPNTAAQPIIAKNVLSEIQALLED